MQFFLGHADYSNNPQFDPSLIGHIRNRFSEEDLKRINELIAERGKAMLIEAVSSLQDHDDYRDPDVEAGNQLSIDELVKPADWPEDKNWGTPSIDASYTPANITDPRDLKLPNEARESTDRIIDNLYKQRSNDRKHHPRYDRGSAPVIFQIIVKQKKPRQFKISAAIRDSETICKEILLPSTL
jgi:IS5 family transposase